MAAVATAALLGFIVVALKASQDQTRDALLHGFERRSRIVAQMTEGALALAARQQAENSTERYGAAGLRDRDMRPYARRGTRTTIATANARTLASTVPDVGSLPPGLRSDIRRAVRTRTPILSDVFNSFVGQSVAVVVPFVAHSGSRRVIVSTLSLTYLSEQLGPYLRAASGVQNGEALVLDGDGLVLASSDPDAKLGVSPPLPGLSAALRSTAPSLRFSSGAEPYRGEVADLHSGGYRSVLVAPESELLAPASGRGRAVPWVAVGLLALSLCAGLALIAKLQARSRALARAGVYKSEFLAGITHELRTPLAVIAAYLHPLAAGAVRDKDEAARIAGEAQDTTAHALSVLAGLADLTGAETGHISITAKPVELRRFAQDCASALSATAAANGVRVLASCDSRLPAWVMLDPTRTRQITFNYLTNAVKHSPPGAEVELRFRMARKEDWLAIEVADRGPGVAASKRTDVFEAYRQLSAEDNAKGVGLGLALVRAIAEAQGGTVGVKDNPGGGALFYATLPAPVALGPRKECTDAAQAGAA